MRGSEGTGEVTGVVLAGGRARRFGGRNKALLEIGGERIVERHLALLREVTVAQVIVANVPDAFSSLGVPVHTDLVQGAGPLGGLHAALRVAHTPRLLVLACDLPFLHGTFLRYLVDRAPDADAVAPRTADGLHPLCAVYARRILPVVEARLESGRLSMHGLLETVQAVIVEPRTVAVFDPDGRLLSNVNSPADYDAALGRARPAAPPSRSEVGQASAAGSPKPEAESPEP